VPASLAGPPGATGHPGKLAEAISLGAAGIQVGTPFAFCEESGIHPELKRQAIALSSLGQARVFTDPVASPTGFPFKVAQLENTLSNAANYHARHRICDLGYLRHLYRRPDGTIGYRCPAEPLEHYRRKGGGALTSSSLFRPSYQLLELLRKRRVLLLQALRLSQQLHDALQRLLRVLCTLNGFIAFSRSQALHKYTSHATESRPALRGPVSEERIAKNPIRLPRPRPLA